MLTKEQLDKLKEDGIMNNRKENLVDINTITLRSPNQKRRFSKFISHVANPYSFRCNNVGVQIVFNQEHSPLEDILTEFLIKNNSV